MKFYYKQDVGCMSGRLLEETGFLICDILSLADKSESFLPRLRNFTEADWNDLFVFSSRYKLVPLLYSKLLRYKDELPIPSGVINLLRSEYMNSAARYATLHHEIKSLLTILNDNKIDVILLKGAYVAEKFYEKPALRPMCDIDILVRKEDIGRCLNILAQNEYRIKDIKEAAGQRQLHCPGVITKSNILIEPHWDISPHMIFPWKNSVDIDKLWNGTAKEKLFGMEVIVLPLECLIVYLCTKITIDNFRGQLLQIYSVALILQKSTLNWDMFFSIASEWDSVKDVFCVLYLAKDLYFADIPDDVFNTLKPDDFNDNIVKFMYGELFGSSKLEGNAAHFMQMISHKNLLTQFKRIFSPENLEVLSNSVNLPGKTERIKFIFKRLQHLIKQYKGVFSFKMLHKSKDITRFYQWLKKK